MQEISFHLYTIETMLHCHLYFKVTSEKEMESGSKYQGVSGIDPSTVQSIGIFEAYLQPVREGLHIQNIWQFIL